MTPLPWWAGALLLGAVPIASWLLLHQVLAVSGRITRIVDWARDRTPRGDAGCGAPAPDPPASDEELLAALQAMTAEEFGLAPEAAPPALPVVDGPLLPTASRSFPLPHLVFALGLALGGAVVALASGAFHPALAIAGTGFSRVAGGGLARQALWLLGGGFLVGIGTRMAGGCTSGHGLCGLSRGQPGSVVSTASFFGAAVAASFALELLR